MPDVPRLEILPASYEFHKKRIRVGSCRDYSSRKLRYEIKLKLAISSDLGGKASRSGWKRLAQGDAFGKGGRANGGRRRTRCERRNRGNRVDFSFSVLLGVRFTSVRVYSVSFQRIERRSCQRIRIAHRSMRSSFSLSILFPLRIERSNRSRTPVRRRSP